MTDIILNARGNPYTVKTLAEKNMPEGYTAVQNESGGWVGVKDKPVDVICPGCGQSYHNITVMYDPGKSANSAMIRLKDKYRSWGWEEVYPDQYSGYGCLVCPDCGAPLAPDGKLRIGQ